MNAPASGHINNDEYHLYLHNRLTLMVPEGNPANIYSVEDMGRDNVRISQPDPENEDIAFHIMDMYRQVLNSFGYLKMLWPEANCHQMILVKMLHGGG